MRGVTAKVVGLRESLYRATKLIEHMEGYKLLIVAGGLTMLSISPK